jgi:hypothetical protein
MCNSNHARFSQAETKFFVGATEIPRNQIREVSQVEYARMFPRRKDGYTLKSGAKRETVDDRAFWTDAKLRDMYTKQAETVLDSPSRIWDKMRREIAAAGGTDAWVSKNIEEWPRSVGGQNFLVTASSPAQAIDRVVKWERKEKQTMCGAKCRGARGPACDCICEGQFHGVSVGMSRARFAADNRLQELLAELPEHERRDVLEHGYDVFEVELHMPEIGMNHYQTVAARDKQDAIRYGKTIAKVRGFKVTKVSAKKLHSRSRFAAEDLDLRPTAEMAKNAERGLALMARTSEEFDEDVQNAGAIIKRWAEALLEQLVSRNYASARALLPRLKAASESLAKELQRPVTNYSRNATPNKDRFSMTYDEAEYQIALAEERIDSRGWRNPEQVLAWTRRANAAMRRADAGDQKAQAEVIQIATTLKNLYASQHSRPGVKAKFASKIIKAQGHRFKITDEGEGFKKIYVEDNAEHGGWLFLRRVGDGLDAERLIESGAERGPVHKWVHRFSRTGAKARLSLIPLSKMREIKKHYEEYLGYVARNPDANDYGKPMSFNQFVDEWTESNELGKADPMHYARPGAKAAFSVDSRIEVLRQKVQTYIAKGGSWQGLDKPEGLAKLVGDIINGSFRPTDTGMDHVETRLRKYHGMNFSRTGAKVRMSQVAQMLAMLESQAHDQPDLAKKNIQKMVDYVAHEGTHDEFMRLVKIAERLGLRGFMSRPGAKAAFAHPSWHEGILGKDTAPALAAYSWIDRSNVPVQGRTQTLLADLAAGVHATSPNLSIEQAVLAAAKDMVRKGVATGDLREWAANGGKFSRPGASEAFALGRVSNAATPQADEALTALAAKVGREHTVSLFKRWTEGKAAMSRDSAKATFANWKHEDAPGWGTFRDAWSASIGGKRWVVQSDGKGYDNGILYVQDKSGAPRKVKTGTIDSLKHYAENAEMSQGSAKTTSATV